MKNKIIIALIICLVLSLFLAGCNKPEQSKKVTIGLLKLTSSAPVFIGIEKGFFKDEKLDIEVKWFDAAHPIAVATASNQINIGATGITASLFNMVAGGQKLAIVADKGREQKGYSSSALVVRKDLWDQGIRNINDLKGKKIGITQFGSTFNYMIGRILEAKGMSLQDVEIVPLAKISAIMAALQSKQVDAVILNEPNISKVVAAGYGKIIVPVSAVMDYQTSAIFFSPDIMKDKAAAVKFLKGYIKATRYYHDAVLNRQDGKIIPGKNYDEVIDIIAKYTKAPKADIKSGLPYMDRDGELLIKDIQTQIDWYTAHKMIQKPLNAGQVVNTALWKDALAQLK